MQLEFILLAKINPMSCYHQERLLYASLGWLLKSRATFVCKSLYTSRRFDHLLLVLAKQSLYLTYLNWKLQYTLHITRENLNRESARERAREVACNTVG
jgi:hypothetical protein